jgi:PAS domain S-box-containing protein
MKGKEKAAEEKRLRQFLEEIPDGCFEVDLNGRFTFCNEALAAMKGYRREEYLKLTPKEIFPPGERERVIATFRQVYETGKPVPIAEYRVLCKDGKEKNFEMSISPVRGGEGEIIGFRGICRDVTERKRMEEENARFREFIENIEDGCWEVDLRGNYRFINKAGARRHGCEPEELIGKTFAVNMRATESERARKIFNEIYRTGNPGYVHDYEVISKDGSVNYLDISATLIRDKEGKPIGFRGVSRVVTERKKFQEQMIRSQKFEAVATLAGGIAHSFNNILMGIQGNVDLMLIKIDSEHEFYPRLKAIENEIRTATDLTRQLLAYARIGPFEMKEVNLNGTLDHMAALLAVTKKEIRIRRDFAPDLMPVRADAGQMEQVFMNLFINAWQAMPSGGTIHIKTENIRLTPEEARNYSLEAGDYVKITVADTGRGMTQEELQKVFDPFFTTREVGQGTGLGLAAVYGIIQNHQGFIDVKSMPGRGTTFVIYLPAAQKREAKEREARKILIVDDEGMITQVTAAMLSALGYETLTAHSGKEAVEVFRENRDAIGLVLMDLTMPEGGGVVAIGKIKALEPTVKIIVMSGYPLEGELKELLKTGSTQAFLQKPFRLADLANSVREVLSK